MTDGELLLICGSLLACGIAAAVLASRIRVPGLLLFLGLGMLLGSDDLGLISFGSGLRRRLARTLVALEDGRFAVTGPLVLVGASPALTRQAQRRLGHTSDDAEIAWWREVIGAVAATGRS